MRNRKAFLIGNETLPLEDRSLLSGALVQLPRQAEIRAANNNSAIRQDFTPRRWQWLANTYWIVPPKGLPAIIFNTQSGKIAPVLDQTVYHITGYRDGYFWGETVAQYSNFGSPSSAAVIGSVTPEGKLLLNFVASDGVTTGIGSMTYKRGSWTMENQMFTGTSTSRIGHWAYMVQVKPGMKAWNNLPFVNVSVPTFLSNYNLPKPSTI
jgi:hypothetical protein